MPGGKSPPKRSERLLEGFGDQVCGFVGHAFRSTRQGQVGCHFLVRWLDGLSIRTLPLGLLDGAIKAGGDVRFEFVMYVLSKSRSSGFWSGVAPLNNVFLHAANQSMPADVQEFAALVWFQIELLKRFFDQFLLHRFGADA